MARHKGGVLVLGLGRFGGAVAETLCKLDIEVLGVDKDPVLVREFSDSLTHVVEADTTDVEALRQLGAEDFAKAIVAIGTDIQASILTTLVVADLGIDRIWAKAITPDHGRILDRVGATSVIFPEKDMGERIAHVVGGRMIDYMALDQGFALVETKPPKAVVGRSLGDTGVRARFGITVVCIKPEGEGFTYATPETVPGPEDILVIAGETNKVESFAATD